MGDNFQFIDIIFFAMVAAFLVLRLRSVLGRRTGTEQRRPDPLRRDQPEIATERRPETVPPRAAADAEPAAPGVESVSGTGLTQIKLADRTFEPSTFVAGARKAFEMVVSSFAAGNRDQLRSLLSNEVYQNFASAIAAREKNGETLETTLVKIGSAEITDAEVRNRTAFVTVKFVSEQINVTRSKAGEIVDGDPAHTTEVTDIWTFARNTQSRDPNWSLVETRSPS